VVATEQQTFLVYHVHNVPPGWDGTSVQVFGPDSDGERVAIISFKHCIARMFGPPNDEAFAGHPLANFAIASVRRFQNRKLVLGPDA
jgi:hypothetical protein